jgi:hypothetical protein
MQHHHSEDRSKGRLKVRLVFAVCTRAHKIARPLMHHEARAATNLEPPRVLTAWHR